MNVIINPVDRILLGLIEKIPAPETYWPVEDRVTWLRAFAACCKIVYRSDGEVTIAIGDRSRQMVGADLGLPS